MGRWGKRWRGRKRHCQAQLCHTKHCHAQHRWAPLTGHTMLQPVLIRSSNKHDGLNWYKHIQDPHTWSSPIWRKCCPFIHDSLTLSKTAALLVMRSRLKRSDRSFTCQRGMSGCYKRGSQGGRDIKGGGTSRGALGDALQAEAVRQVVRLAERNVGAGR